jgi:CRISPR/Cas system-associated exonuclease Cas4 (RecB family)
MRKARGEKPSAREVKKRLEQTYGINSVRAADIAEQLFCEKKVELRLLRPEIKKGASQLAGLTAHEELAAEARPISRKELNEQLASGKKILLRETLFSGRHREIPIVGKPDLVFFDRMRPLFLVDYKFSAKRETYPDQRLQVALYGMLLHQNKFETELLVTIIAFVSRAVAEGNRERELLKIYQRLRETALTQQRQAVHQDGDVACFAYPFVLSRAKELLDKQTDFWLGLRSAVPTTHPRKCSVCEFNAAGLCESALAAPVPKP